MTIPTTEPREITQARTVKWTRSLADYPAGDGWQLSYSIVYGTTTVALAWGTHVTASGDDFAITLPATLITGLTAGVNARLNGVVSLAGEVFDVYDGALRIKVVGELSFARAAVAAMEAIAPTFLGREEQEIEISGGGVNQRLSFRSLAEFNTALRDFRQQVANEVAAERAANGLGTGRMIRTRYTSPR